MTDPLRVGVLMVKSLTRDMLLTYLSESRALQPVLLSLSGADGAAPELDVVVVGQADLPAAGDRWPGVPRLSFQDSSHPAEMAEALHEGASAVLDGSASLHDVVEAVQAVARGQTWLPPSQVTAVLTALSAARPRSERLAVASLSPREREVMVLMGEGLTRREIAERLVVSPHTARTHVQNVLLKLGAHSQVAVGAVARRALQAGWLEAKGSAEEDRAPS